MSTKVSFGLPYPTSRTIVGPELHLQSSLLEVRYDCEQDDGAVEWVQVSFHDTLAFEYRQVALCKAEDLDAYNKIVKYLESDWLDEMKDRWRNFLGSQASESQGQRYAHWRIYFDDAGCIDVIAKSFQIG